MSRALILLAGVLFLDACAPELGRPDASLEDGMHLCRSAADCDDGDFCNGLERCAPSEATADIEGCVEGRAPCGAGTCSPSGCSDCMPPDADGDGRDGLACGGDDCDDTDAARRPELPEVCDDDGHDEDCDPLTFGRQDGDGDGLVSSTCCNVEGEVRACGTDCDDASALVRPGAPERCNDLDDDCDGTSDEGTEVTYFADTDGDGFGVDDRTTLACVPIGAYSALLGGDCAESDPMVHPGGAEVCNGLDDDCSGVADDGAATASCSGPGTFAADCVAGRCELECVVGMADCDGDPSSGCERSVRTVLDCGSCGRACDEPHGSAVCIEGRCEAATCHPGYHPCGGRCELETARSCGPSCEVCSVPEHGGVAVCGGSCSVRCESSYRPAADGSARCLYAYAELADLRVVGGVITPTVALSRYGYAADVPLAQASTQIVVDVRPGFVGTITLDGVPITAGGLTAPLALAVGENVFFIDVTAESGASNRYEVRVTRGWDGWHYLKTSSTAAGDELGAAVALSGDTLVVGAPGRRGPSGGSEGAAFVFRREGESWSLAATLAPTELVANARFGSAVAVDGDVIVVGAPYVRLAAGAGAAYVFRRNGAGYDLEQRFAATAAADSFGAAVAVQGARIAVGAPLHEGRASTGEAVSRAGAVRVFEREGGPWVERATIEAVQLREEAWFGTALSLRGDTLVVGSPGDDTTASGIDGAPIGVGPRTGAAHVITRMSGGVWQESAYLKPDADATVLGMGRAVAFDGTFLAVGTSGSSSDYFGRVLVYRVGPTGWATAGVIQADQRTAFGASLAWAGPSLLVGAPYESGRGRGVGSAWSDLYTSNRLGAAYLYAREGASWRRTLYVKAPNSDPGDVFATAVAAEGDLLVFGAPLEDGGASGVDGPLFDESAAAAGAVYTVNP